MAEQSVTLMAIQAAIGWAVIGALFSIVLSLLAAVTNGFTWPLTFAVVAAVVSLVFGVFAGALFRVSPAPFEGLIGLAIMTVLLAFVVGSIQRYRGR